LLKKQLWQGGKVGEIARRFWWVQQAHGTPPLQVGKGVTLRRPMDCWEDFILAPPIAMPPLNLGFLTVVREPTGYFGGYLVTNQWGRPLEFRLSTAVQPNRVQQILYAETLEPYICGDLIGKTLVDKTGVPVQMVVTDTEPALDLRQRLEVPVVLLLPASEAGEGEKGDRHGCAKHPLGRPGNGACPLFHLHARFPSDGPVIEGLLDKVHSTLDLAEPFARIRQAMSEARRMGVTSRG
jgi:hypothetical protein